MTSAGPGPGDKSKWQEKLPESIPGTTLEYATSRYNEFRELLYQALLRGDEAEVLTLGNKMRAIQAQYPEAVPRDLAGEHATRIQSIRLQLEQITDDISSLKHQAISGSQEGKEQQMARAIRGLLKLHASHPDQLDEGEMEDIRRSVANAADERARHIDTARKLIQRERAVTAEVKALAEAVRHFHDVACKLPADSAKFHEAEQSYFRTVDRVETYDTEWFSGLVLELADMLAHWSEPPAAAESQIDRFLDSVTTGLAKIRLRIRRFKHPNPVDGESQSRQSEDKEPT